MSDQELRLSKECREIEHRIREGAFREQLRFRSRWAVRPDDVLLGFLEDEPTVLHFSGHGSGEAGLWFEGVDGRAILATDAMLESMMRAAGDIKLVVLNACYTDVQARVVIEHTPCVVSMPHAIEDAAAIAYSAGFYRALSFGQSLAAAHQHGLASLVNAEGSTKDRSRNFDVADAACALARQTPRLMTKPGLDPRQLFVVTASDLVTTPSAPNRARQVHIEITINSEFERLDAPALAAILADLRRLVDGKSVQIVCVVEGSIRLTISVSPETAAQLLQLRAGGQLQDLNGALVSEVLEVAEVGRQEAVHSSHEGTSQELKGPLLDERAASDVKTPSSDEALWKAWRNGNSKSGNVLFMRYYDVILRFFANKARQSASDLVQETFLLCVSDSDEAKEGSFRTLIFGAAFHVLKTHWRMEEYRQWDSSGRIDDDGGGSSERSNAGRAEKYQHQIALSALRQLSLSDQAVLELYYWDNLSVHDIASVLKESFFATRARLYRARYELVGKMHSLLASPASAGTTLETIDELVTEAQMHLGVRSVSSVRFLSATGRVPKT